jgi:hypothetical protein
MDLVSRFEMANTCKTVSLGTLDVDRAYPILFAERVTTNFGPSIVITLGATQVEAVKVFLPNRYIGLFKDEDIYDINHQKVCNKPLIHC